MGMKKGQVTIFIILAIVFVTIIGLILFINSGAEKEGRRKEKGRRKKDKKNKGREDEKVEKRRKENE